MEGAGPERGGRIGLERSRGPERGWERVGPEGSGGPEDRLVRPQRGLAAQRRAVCNQRTPMRNDTCEAWDIVQGWIGAT